MARKKAQPTNNRRRAPAPISTKSAINTTHGHQPSSARHDHLPTTTTEAPATTLVANRNHESHTTHVVPSTAAKNEGGAREDLADTKRMSTPELVDVIPAHHHVDHLSLTARSQAAHKEMDLLATSAQLILGEEELRYLGHHPTHSTTAYPSSSSNTTHNIDGSGGSTSHGSVRGGVANTHSVISIHPMHPLEEVLSRSIASAGKFGGGSASFSPSAQSKRSSILSASLSSSSIADVVEEDVEHIHHHQDGSRSRRAVGAPPITHAGVNGGTTPQNIVNVPAQRSSLKLEDAQHSRRVGDEHEPSSSPPTPSLLRLPPLHRRGDGAPSRSSSISSVVPPTHKDDVGVRPPAAHNNDSSSLLIKHESTPRKHTSSRRSSSSNQSLLSHSAHKTSNRSRASPSSQLPLILPSTRNTSLRAPRPPPSSSPVLPTLTEASSSRVPPSPSRGGQLHPLASSAHHLPSLGRQAGTSYSSTSPANDAANTNTSLSPSSRTHIHQSPQFNAESSASEEHYPPPRYTDTADTNNRSIASSASFGNDDAHAAPPKPSTDVPPPLLPTESSSTDVVHDNSSATSSRNTLHQNTSNRRVCFSTEPDALTATSHKIGSSSAPGADSSSSTRISSPSHITQDLRQHRHDHRKRCSATDDDIPHMHVDGTHGARLSRPVMRGDDVSASPTVGVDERRNVLQHLVDVCDTPPHPTKPTPLSTTSHPPSAAEEIGPPSCVPHKQQHSARIHNHVGGVVRRPSADRRSPPILSSSPPLTHSNTQRTSEENKSDFFSMSDVVGATPQTSTSPVSEHHISKFYVAFSARGADDDDDDDASRVSSAPPIHSAHSASGGAPHDVYDVGVVKTHPLQSSSSMLIINTPAKRDDEGRSSRMQHTTDDVSMSCSVASSTEMEPPTAEVTACRNDRRTASSSPPPLLDDERTSHHLPSSREGAPWRFIMAFSARGDDDDGRLPCSGTNTTEGSIISVAPPIRNAASLDDIQRNIISPDAWKTHPLQNSTDFLVIATQPAMHHDDDDDVLMRGDPPRTTEGVMMDRASSAVGFKEGRTSSPPTRPSADPPTSKIHQHVEDVQPDDEDDVDGTTPHVKLPLSSAVDEPDIPTRHLENSVSTRTHGMRDAHINTQREPTSDVHQRSSPHKDADVAPLPLLRRAQKRAAVDAPSSRTHQQHADDVAHVPSKKHMNGTQTSTRAPSVKDASTIVTLSVTNAATQASTCATRTSSVNAAAQTNKRKPSSDLAPRKPPKKLNRSALVAPQKPSPRVIRRSSTNNNNNVKKNIQTVAPIINNNNIKPTKKKKKIRRVGPPTQPPPPLPRPRATQRRNIRAWRRRRGAPRQLPWRRMNFSMDLRMTTDPPRKLSAQRRRSLMQSPSHMPRRSRRRATHVAHPPVPRRGRPLPRRTRRVFCHPRIYLRHRANIMGKRAAKLLKPFTRRRPARPQPRPAPPSSSRPPTMFSLGSSPQDLHIRNKDDGDVYGYLLTRHGFWGEAMRHIAVG